MAKTSTFTRFIYVYLLFLLAGLGAIVRIILVQVNKDRITLDDIYKEQVLEPSRGSILSYDGRPLAVSIPVYDLHWDSKAMPDSVLMPKIAYKNELLSARKAGKRYLKIGDRKVDFGELTEIRQFPVFRLGQFKGGLIVDTDSERVNPYGKLANRTIGYLNADGGGTGIEYTYDYKLRGEKGVQTIHRTLGDQWIPVNGASVVPAVDGYDIRTTIDVRIQEAAETELREQLAMSDVFEGGTAIVMDVKTGAIRGIANMFKKSDGTFDESYNYAIAHATEPGSTLKLAALMAMIEDGCITLDTEVDGGDGRWRYAGHWITDTHRGGYGKMTALEAFEKSSNIAFAKMITEAYGDDPATYVSRLHNMKLVEKLNLDIGGEGYAYITSPDDPQWSGSTLASLGYGYALTVTPMHILTFYNAVANGGKMMRPYFIEDFEKDGIVEESSGPTVVSGSICSKSTLKAVRKALRGVVEEGTAKICNDERYAIAGKTGTARVAINGRYEDSEGYRRHQASFAGYFPADDPKYSCIVVLYTGKTRGNGLAGQKGMPIDYMPMRTRPVEDGWIHVDLDKSSGEQSISGLAIEQGIVPDVEGMGIKDAVYLLENEGYKVVFHGSGRVSSQTPAAGDPLEKGKQITLTLK